MDATARESWTLTAEDLEILAQLLESERSRLLVEIRHTDHRAFRDRLRQRLAVIESLAGRCPANVAGGESA